MLTLVASGDSCSSTSSLELSNVRERVFANLMSVTWYLMVASVCITLP